MDCCQCQGIETVFDKNYVTKKVKRYREKGPNKTTRQLIEAITVNDIRGKTLLDIGGGIGVIQFELFKHGIWEAINVEASSAFVEACKVKANKLGLDNRIHHYNGDFTDLAESIHPADIVTLDRVICCYPEMDKMVNLSAEKALKYYGLVYPRDKWWVKIGFFLLNLRFRLQGNPFRVYAHSCKEVDAIIKSNGLKRFSNRKMGVWQMVVYERS